jgi:hypothetical protein
VRSREERVDTDRNDEATFDLRAHATRGDGAFGELGENVLPVLLLLRLIVRNDRVALLVLDLFDQDFDGGTDLQITEIDEFMGRDDTF